MKFFLCFQKDFRASKWVQVTQVIRAGRPQLRRCQSSGRTVEPPSGSSWCRVPGGLCTESGMPLGPRIPRCRPGGDTCRPFLAGHVGEETRPECWEDGAGWVGQGMEQGAEEGAWVGGWGVWDASSQRGDQHLHCFNAPLKPQSTLRLELPCSISTLKAIWLGVASTAHFPLPSSTDTLPPKANDAPPYQLCPHLVLQSLLQEPRTHL